MPLNTESVWDYPRPAICEPFTGHLKIIVNKQILADTRRAYRSLETSHPPCYYFPPEDVHSHFLKPNSHSSLCEWKGQAHYVDWQDHQNRIVDIGWFYKNPSRRFHDIAGYISFYASKAEACFVNGEQVSAQEGDFYGGWITRNLKGPFKGGTGTLGW
ncbi:MAG: DUF427 domain-containing protein [Pseudomonadota bacterium]